MVTSLKSLVEAPNVQGCPLLEKLPLELRYMIYEHIFNDCTEIRLPHPLMLVSKQVQADATDAAARIIGPKLELRIDVLTASAYYKLQYRFGARDYADGHFRPGRWGGPHVLGRCVSGSQLLPRIPVIEIHWSLTWTIFVIMFRPGSLSPEITLEGSDGSVDGRTKVKSDDAKKLFLALADKWRSNQSGCSLEWIQSCIEDLWKGWAAKELLTIDDIGLAEEVPAFEDVSLTKEVLTFGNVGLGEEVFAFDDDDLVKEVVTIEDVSGFLFDPADKR
ncbi:hypothetical protein KCU92_g6858, partial [Aureobasidium melanogenum]